MRHGLLLIALVCGAVARGDDWPTSRHDNHRSGKTSERLAAANLHQQWVRRSAHPPQPAWAGPAKWDGP
mgnify:CR=1 FL=1